jgi:glycosyltransferase involved in cell wall biosynthesis
MKLPTPHTLKEIRAHTPRIARVPEGIWSPFWSVMIPTYNNGRYLRRTLESVLCQDVGPSEMQIEIVDSCSTEDNPEELVKELGKGRVTYHRLPCNRGPAHTFNTCIERSRGRWLHILHGDDMVLPQFYGTYEAIAHAHPKAQAVLGEVISIDENDRWTGLFRITPAIDGDIVSDFARREATRQLVQFPGVIVRRAAYEAIGGYCTLFDHVCDWDMWFRLGQFAPVAFVPRPYALYRVHSESDTSRRIASGENMRESYFVIRANLERLNELGPLEEERSWRARLAQRADTTAWRLDERDCTEGQLNQACWAWMLEPSPRRLTMLLKSWVKHKLNVSHHERRIERISRNTAERKA